MNVELTWATPNAEEMITHMARVSAPKNQGNMETAPKLLKYLITHKHWSPYEMANMCVEINTTRAISAQIIRHRSFSLQEFSQRYADTNELALLPSLTCVGRTTRTGRTVSMICHLILLVPTTDASVSCTKL
jgi:thymidylate synthase (FAD)